MIKLSFRRGAAFASKKARKHLETINPEDVKNITVIRHAAIGDWIVARPFLIELKKYFPKAIITLSVMRTYMYGMPRDLVDAIHIVDKDDPNNKAKKTSLLTRIKQARELPSQDIIFDLTDSSLSLLLIIFSKAKLKVGYPYRWVRRLFYDIATLRSDFVFETMSMLHQLNILGANTKHYPLEYKLSNKTANQISPYIIYFAGASMEARCWGNQNFIELIKLMLDQFPTYKHVILKGIRDDEQFQEIYASFQNSKNVIHQNALPVELIYDYLAESSLVVVGDTGIRNMAIGVNTPTIGIMFTPYISPMRYLPQTETHKVIFNPDCSKPTVENVLKSILCLMNVENN